MKIWDALTAHQMDTRYREARLVGIHLRTGSKSPRAAASAIYNFVADVALENADYGASQRYRNVRYTLNVYAEDKDGIEVFSFNGEDRASHATDSEARQLALRKIEESISEESEKSFAAEFNGYLSSLLE
jgi:hypothetical protein